MSAAAAAGGAPSRIVLITGGNRGIGFAVIQQLARAHPEWTILLGARTQEKCAQAIQQLQLGSDSKAPAGSGSGATTVHPLVVDIDSAESIAEAARQVRSRYGRLDVLVNNAAIEGAAAPETFHTNVTGTLAMIDAFLPLMTAEKPAVAEGGEGAAATTAAAGPSILNLSSADAVDALNDMPAKLRERWLDPNLTMEGVSRAAQPASAIHRRERAHTVHPRRLTHRIERSD